MRTRSRMLATVCIASALGLVAAGCGSDDEEGAATASPAATEAPGATQASGGTAAPASTDAPADTDAAASTEAPASTDAPAGSGAPTGTNGSSGGGDCASGVDDSVDAEEGAGAGWLAWALTCAAENPMEAEGDPIVIGIQNPEGDPAGSFPEYRLGVEAAAEFINSELGGVGADYENGTPGRPIKLEVCSMLISPADSQRCANELASKNPFAVYSTLNFFGNQFDVFTGAGVPVFVGTPVAPADFATPGVYAIGGGGGCLGIHTGTIEFMTNDLGLKKVGVPYTDTPPGVFCYNNLLKTPLNVLNGSTEGAAEAAGSIPELTQTGIPIAPNAADISAQATEVLDFDPDGITYTANAADCWTFVSALSRLGWDPKTTPLVLGAPCIDTERAKEAGEFGEGIYFVGSTPVQDPSVLTGMVQNESQIYNDKMDEYGGGDVKSKAFASQGFVGTMFIWQMANEAADGDVANLSGEAFTAAVAATSGHHAFGSTPESCADAVAPYLAVCNSIVTATQFDGEKYNVVRSNFSGVFLIEGTELDFGS